MASVTSEAVLDDDRSTEQQLHTIWFGRDTKGSITAHGYPDFYKKDVLPPFYAYHQHQTLATHQEDQTPLQLSLSESPSDLKNTNYQNAVQGHHRRPLRRRYGLGHAGQD